MDTYLALGFNRALFSNIGFETNLLLKLTPGDKVFLNLNSMLSFNENLKLGANYKTNNTFSPVLKLKFQNLEIGYAYEFPITNTLFGLGVKTHEILLKFNLDNNNTGGGDNEPSE